MKRPNKEDYYVFSEETSCDEFLSNSYISDLENYCEYLENKKTRDKKYINKLLGRYPKYFKLEAAFEEACKELEKSNTRMKHDELRTYFLEKVDEKIKASGLVNGD